MRPTSVARTAAVLLVAALAAPCAAHETWLAPSAWAVKPGAVVRLSLTSGMSFPKLESPIRPERVAASGVRLAGETRAAGPWNAGATALETTAALKRSGVACLWVTLHPRGIDLSEAQVEEYFAEIGADSALRARWSATPRPRAWHETYTKHAKSFVGVGGGGADTSWRIPVGLTVELVPLFAPDRVRVGDEVAVRLLSDGRPESGAVIGLMQGRDGRTFATTDEAGLARFRVPLAGPALFFTVRLRPAPKGSAWVSDFSTLTVDVARAGP